MKTCTKCLKEKALDQFQARVGRKHGATHSWCKACVRKANQRDYDAERGYKLKCTFGITLEEYNALSEEQDHLCAICRKPETVVGNGKRVRKLAVDHDHTTGKVRGLLCTGCNTALGRFNDDITLLEKAIHYLKSYEGL